MNAYQSLIDAIYSNDINQLNSAINQAKKEKLRISQSEGEGKLFSAIIRLINSNWIEGWKVIYRNIKPILLSGEEGEFPVLWSIAIMDGNIEVLKDLEELGYIKKYRDNNRRNTIHILFNTLGMHKIRTPSNEKIKEMIDFFSKDINLYESYPGYFKEGDTFKNGNAFWSYAIKQDNWDLAQYTLPEKWDDIIKTPRWKESFIYLQKTVQKERSDNMENLWKHILSLFLNIEQFRSLLEFKSIEDISYLFSASSSENREFLWEFINKQDSNQRTFWHQLAGQPKHPLFKKMIEYAIADKINIQPYITQQDIWNERPIDSYFAFWEITEESKDEQDINNFVFLKENLTKDDLHFTSDLMSVPIIDKIL